MLTANEAYAQIGRIYQQLSQSVDDKLLLQKQMRSAVTFGEIDHRQRLNNNRELLAMTEVRNELQRIVEGHSKECVQLVSELHHTEDVNEYQFLRAAWTNHRANDETALDDRLDRLNKVVAMVRGHLSVKFTDMKISQQSKLADMEQATEVASLIEEPLYVRLKESMEAAIMEKEDMAEKMSSQLASHRKLVEQHNHTVQELKKVKEKVRNLELRYLESCKREQEANDKLMRINNEQQKGRNRSLYRGSGFILEILEQVSRTSCEVHQEQARVNIALADIKKFLEQYIIKEPAAEAKPTELLQASLTHPSIPRLLLRGEKQNILSAVLKTQQFERTVREYASPSKNRSRSRSKLLTPHLLSNNSNTDRSCGEGSIKFTRKQASQQESDCRGLFQESNQNKIVPPSSRIFDERSFFTRQLSKPGGCSSGLLTGLKK